MTRATKPYVIQQGDYLDKVAYRFGFDAKAVWEDGGNAELRAKRKPEQLHPGDVLQIPNKPVPALDLRDGTTNRYVASLPLVPLNLVFEVDGKPCANEACVVDGLGAPLESQTDGSGRLALSVPVLVREVSVRFVKRNVVHTVRIGNMDPIDESSGVVKRLIHLALLGEHQKNDPAAVADAIHGFQAREGLRPTGTVDDETKAALVRVHGS